MNRITLNEEEKATYAWQMTVPGFGEIGQEKLRNACVMVSRCGGLGSVVAYELAAAAAYRQSMPKAGPQLMEPIMRVDVYTPEEHVGDVIGDLNRRRGMIKSQEAGHTNVHI